MRIMFVSATNSDITRFPRPDLQTGSAYRNFGINPNNFYGIFPTNAEGFGQFIAAPAVATGNIAGGLLNGVFSILTPILNFIGKLLLCILGPFLQPFGPQPQNEQTTFYPENDNNSNTTTIIYDTPQQAPTKAQEKPQEAPFIDGGETLSDKHVKIEPKGDITVTTPDTPPVIKEPATDNATTREAKDKPPVVVPSAQKQVKESPVTPTIKPPVTPPVSTQEKKPPKTEIKDDKKRQTVTISTVKKQKEKNDKQKKVQSVVSTVTQPQEKQKQNITTKQIATQSAKKPVPKPAPKQVTKPVQKPVPEAKQPAAKPIPKVEPKSVSAKQPVSPAVPTANQPQKQKKLNDTTKTSKTPIAAQPAPKPIPKVEHKPVSAKQPVTPAAPIKAAAPQPKTKVERTEELRKQITNNSGNISFELAAKISKALSNEDRQIIAELLMPKLDSITTDSEPIDAAEVEALTQLIDLDIFSNSSKFQYKKDKPNFELKYEGSDSKIHAIGITYNDRNNYDIKTGTYQPNKPVQTTMPNIEPPKQPVLGLSPKKSNEITIQTGEASFIRLSKDILDKMSKGQATPEDLKQIKNILQQQTDLEIDRHGSYKSIEYENKDTSVRFKAKLYTSGDIVILYASGNEISGCQYNSKGEMIKQRTDVKLPPDVIKIQS